LPGKIEGLYRHVIERLERDLPVGLVLSTLLLFLAAENGLTETECITLLEEDAQEHYADNLGLRQPTPSTDRESARVPVSLWWPPLFRNLQSLLVPKEQVPSKGLHNFAHRQAREAVRHHYLEEMGGSLHQSTGSATNEEGYVRGCWGGLVGEVRGGRDVNYLHKHVISVKTRGAREAMSPYHLRLATHYLNKELWVNKTAASVSKSGDREEDFERSVSAESHHMLDDQRLRYMQQGAAQLHKCGELKMLISHLADPSVFQTLYNDDRWHLLGLWKHVNSNMGEVKRLCWEECLTALKRKEKDIEQQVSNFGKLYSTCCEELAQQYFDLGSFLCFELASHSAAELTFIEGLRLVNDAETNLAWCDYGGSISRLRLLSAKLECELTTLYGRYKVQPSTGLDEDIGEGEKPKAIMEMQSKRLERARLICSDVLNIEAERDHEDEARALLGKAHFGLAWVKKFMGVETRKVEEEFLSAKKLQSGIPLSESLDSLGNLYLDTNDTAKAALCLEECFKIRTKILSRYHPDLAAVRVSRGRLHRLQDEHPRAVREYRIAAEIYSEVKPDHIDLTLMLALPYPNPMIESDKNMGGIRLSSFPNLPFVARIGIYTDGDATHFSGTPQSC